MNQTLNDDGMFLPGPSKPSQSSGDNNEETPLASGSDFESGQRSPDRKRRHGKGRHMQDIIPNKKPGYHRYSASSLEKKVEKSESSIN